MKKLLTLFCIIFLLISCKEEIEDNSGTYISNNIEIGDIKLYSKYGEIQDSKTINNFIKAHDELHYFIQNSDSAIEIKNPYKIVILPTNQAKLINWGDTTNYSIIRKNQVLYLETKDTMQYGNQVTTPFYQKMLMYSPIYSEIIDVPSPPYEFNSITRFNPCIYIFLSENVITYPLLTYLYFQFYQDGASYSSLTYRNINNIFNKESTKLLNETDTIAIQQNYLKLSKEIR